MTGNLSLHVVTPDFLGGSFEEGPNKLIGAAVRHRGRRFLPPMTERLTTSTGTPFWAVHRCHGHVEIWRMMVCVM